MKISRHSLFLFVEGREFDLPFYENLCSEACIGTGLSFQLKRACEIRGAEGKTALIYYHDYLRRKKALSHNSGGHRTIIAFMLDKDVDDLLRRKRRSPHLIYTQYYDIQNHIFRAGNLTAAVSNACSITHAQAAAEFDSTWFAGVQQKWSSWVALCILCKQIGIGHANYGSVSTINAFPSGPTSIKKYLELVRRLQPLSGMPKREFLNKLARAHALVETLIERDKGDVVFKGKWYAVILGDDVRKRPSLMSAGIKGVEGRIAYCLTPTLDFHAPWAQYFVSALKRLL